MKNYLLHTRLSGGIAHTLVFIVFVAVSLVLSSCAEEGLEDPSIIAENSVDYGIMSKIPSTPGDLEELIPGLELLGPTGSTIGPGGDLFVAESVTGTIWQINLKTKEVSEFATGLPQMIGPVGLGGVMDVVFVGSTAYALVSLVGPQFGSSDINGIYRVTGPNSYEIVADIGQFTIDNPPDIPFNYFVDMGVQYALEFYKGGFLVTDGHHNRVYSVAMTGEVSVFKAFGNIAPTGLEVHGKTVYMSQAGSVDHLPETGKILAFDFKSSDVTEIASGARLLVDVELNRGQTLYALSQGFFPPGNPDGSPAQEGTGSLVKANKDGTFSIVASEIDRPTSMEFSGNSVFIVSLSGKIFTISNVGGPPFGP